MVSLDESKVSAEAAFLVISLVGRAATSSNFTTRVLFNHYSTLERVLFFTVKSRKLQI